LGAVGIGIGWDFGALWMPRSNGNGDNGTVLRCVQTWSSPRIDAAHFIDVCRELELRPGGALPGKVWEEGAPRWVSDVAADPALRRAPAAEHVGLHAGFGFPVVHGGEVLGVLEFLTREIREPDHALLSDFAVFGFQMGQFIERERVERQLRESRDQLEAILSSVPSGIIALNPPGKVVLGKAIECG